MARNVDDRGKLPKEMNLELDRVLDPDERVLVTLQGVSNSGLAATDRRAFIWKKKTLQAFNYEALSGVDWGEGFIHWVLLKGPGLDPTHPKIANVASHPNALQTTRVTNEERAAFERLVPGARKQGDVTPLAAPPVASSRVESTPRPSDPTARVGKTERAALAKVLEPGETVIQALPGLEVVYRTDRRLLTLSPSFTGTGVWSCPLELIERVSYSPTRLKGAIISIDSYDHVRYQGATRRRKFSVNGSPGLADFPNEVIRAVNARLADLGGRRPLEVALEGATSGWTIPVVIRNYSDNSDGYALREAEVALFARHGYAPTSSLGATGALKTKQLILTGGIGAAIGYAAGKGGVHEIGTTTVTFAKVASPAAPDGRGRVDTPPAIPATILESNDTKICPDCAETVNSAARICRYCRYEFGH